MRIARTLLSGLCLALIAVLLTPAAMSQTDPIQAYVPTGFGDTTGVVARMQALGWTVVETATLDLEGGPTPADAYAAFDVVWIVAPSDAAELSRSRGVLSHELDGVARRGGIVVIADLGSSDLMLDLAPGGVDVVTLPDGGGGTVTITAGDHALITGTDCGGTALTDADLDPAATGGFAYLSDLPDGTTVIAENASGPVVVEYSRGDGRVIVCIPASPSSDCADNIIRYAGSLVP